MPSFLETLCGFIESIVLPDQPTLDLDRNEILVGRVPRRYELFPIFETIPIGRIGSYGHLSRRTGYLCANSHAQESRGNGSGILAWACVLAGKQNFQLFL